MLSASLNHLVSRGALRRGTVIRVLEYFAGFIRNQRVIIVIQLEILHAECTLIRSPTISEANATQHIGLSGGLAIHEPGFMPCTQQVLSNLSCSPDKRVLDSSVTPKAEPTVINLPFGECVCSMPAQSTVDAKMQQLSLKDNQNQRVMIAATDSPGLSGAISPQLTPGAVMAISEQADGNGTLQPMLQVVDVQMVNNVRNPERFRMVLPDGVYTMQSMLATAENMRVRDGSIQKGSIIHLQEFTCSTIQNRRIIIVFKLFVLQSECNIMGNPKPYELSRNFVRKTIAQIKDENLGRSDRPDFITVRAVLSHVETDKFCYQACTLELNGKRCYKKVTRNGDGTWYCDKCNQLPENCEYRYVLLCQIKDHTGTTHTITLQEAGEAIFGHTAQELFMIRNVEQDDVRFTGIMQAALWREYRFKLRIDWQTFNGEQRVRCTITGVEKLEETNNLLKDVSRPILEDNSSYVPRVGLAIHEPCFMPCTQQVISNSSCSPDTGVLDSSVTPKPEPTMINLPFSECVSSMPAQSTVDAKMQQLSLKDNQTQRVTITATDSPGLSGAIAPQLTPDAVMAISEQADGNGTLQPMLQVVDVQMVNNVRNPSTERFRMVLSDGVYTMQSMLTTAENTRVRDGSIQKGSIIHLQEFTCSTILNRRIIIVIKVYVLQSECNIMGNPKPYEMRNQPYEQVTNLPANTSCISLSREISNMSRNFVRKTIAQIKDENLGRSGKPDFVTVRAVLSNVKTDKFCYQACTLELNGKRCYKKVTKNDDGTWYCDRCNQCTENCEYRYVLLCQIKDHTGTTHAIALQEAGEAIFGHTAQELFMIRSVEQDDVRFTGIMQAVPWREYLFKLRINDQTFNGEQRVRYTIIGVEKLEETNNLLNDVSRPNLEDDSSYIPSVGSANLEAKQSLLISSNAYDCATGVCATGFAQSDWMPAPISFI